MAIIPPGNALVSATFQITGVKRKPVITLGLDYGTHPVASFVNTVWREAISQSGSGCPFEHASMSPDYTLFETKALLNVGGVLFSDTDPTQIQGTSVVILNPPSPNTSIVIQKVTAQAGRQFRGRLFSPPANLDEGDINAAGVINSTQQAVQTAFWAHVFSSLMSNGMVPVLLHEPPKVGLTPGPTTLTQFKMTPLVGTNRRRIR